MTDHLLPQSASKQEQALSLATARVGAVPVPVAEVWDADKCPSHLLPWLAWAFSVDEWDDAWSDERKRSVIRVSAEVHRYKGTVYAIRAVLQGAGYGDARLTEGNSSTVYGGQFTHNGEQTHGDPAGWARYRFNLSRPIPTGEGVRIRRVLEATAPARCHLQGVSFTDAQFYNGEPRHDGTYNHGVV